MSCALSGIGGTPPLHALDDGVGIADAMGGTGLLGASWTAMINACPVWPAAFTAHQSVATKVIRGNMFGAVTIGHGTLTFTTANVVGSTVNPARLCCLIVTTVPSLNRISPASPAAANNSALISSRRSFADDTIAAASA